MSPIRLVILLIAAAVVVPMAGRPALAQVGPEEHIKVGPTERAYILERFHTDQAQGRLPIIIFLPGLGTRITEGVPARFNIPFTAQPGMVPVLVVHPQGVDRRWDSAPSRITTWQRLADADGRPVDEIGFLHALIDRMVTEENGDPARVYVAGVSSGGYLAARVACEMGDTVAAVADVIATSLRAMFRSCDPRPVPFAMIASTTDDTNPYAGRGGDDVHNLASAPETAFFFAKHNGCGTRAETALPHADPAVASTVSLVRFSGCVNGADVLFYRVDGSGHSVPSLAPIGEEGWEESGRRNRDMETAQVLWDFFQGRRLGTR